MLEHPFEVHFAASLEKGRLVMLAAAFPVLQPQSPAAQAMYDLLVLVGAISAVNLAVIGMLILVAIVRGRRTTQLPGQAFGSRRREISWMVAPVLIVLWVGTISAKLILTMNAYPRVAFPVGTEPDAEVTVVAHQWWWEVRYDESEVVGANEVHIPVGAKIRIKLNSADVIHCFWVPELARKMDAIPGRDNYLWLQADQPGVYQGRCAEFCGNQHAWMNFQVHAHTPQDYAAWLTTQQAAANDVAADPNVIAGKDLFFAQTCANCHTIDGTTAQADIGPNLTHLAARQMLGSGVLENTPDNLRRWLSDPQEYKPGCKMPNFNLSASNVDKLAAYLESLR